MTARRGSSHLCGGFTLLELLVVVSISAALIVLLGLVYRQVQRTGQGLAAVDSDWQVQMFLRRQLTARDERFEKLELTRGERTSLQLVTRYSAGHAMAGPPVLAQYLYLATEERLVYREVPLPPWWLEGQSAVEYRNRARAEATLRAEQQDLLEGVSALGFDYGDGSDAGWSGAWLTGPETEPPYLVRLTFRRLGSEVVWSMPTRLLRYGLPEVLAGQEGEN